MSEADLLSKRTPIQRAIAGLTLISMLVSLPAPYQAQAAQPAVFVPAQSTAETFGLEKLPREIAVLREVFLPQENRSNSLILHIQDAHANLDSQQHTQAILEWLAYHPESPLRNAVSTSGLRIVSEAAEGEIHPEYFNFFPDRPEVNEVMVQDLLHKGEVTGAEMFAWKNLSRTQSPAQVFMTGAENAPLYRENLKIYQDLLSRKPRLHSAIEPLAKKLELAESRIFSTQLYDFLKERSRRKLGDYGSGKNSPQFITYLHFLIGAAETHLGIRISQSFEQIRFPSLARIHALKGVEQTFDAEKADTETAALIGQLTAAAAAPAEKDFIQTLHNLRAHPAPRRPAEDLARLAQMRGINLKDFPHFMARLGQQILLSEVQAEELTAEMTLLETWVVEKLAQAAEEKELVQLLDDFLTLEKLLTLELTRTEFRLAAPRRSEIAFGFMNQRIDTLLQTRRADGRAGNAAQETERLLTPAIDSAWRFYEIADQRDQILLTAAEKSFAVADQEVRGSSQPEALVLVTGGFHTEGLVSLMRERGLAYAVVQPQIRDADSHGLYEKVMLGENAEMSSYFNKSYLTKQEALFLKSYLETGVRALFEKGKVPAEKIAPIVAEAINNHPVLSRKIKAVPQTESGRSNVQINLISEKSQTAVPDSTASAAMNRLIQQTPQAYGALSPENIAVAETAGFVTQIQPAAGIQIITQPSRRAASEVRTSAVQTSDDDQPSISRLTRMIPSFARFRRNFPDRIRIVNQRSDAETIYGDDLPDLVTVDAYAMPFEPLGTAELFRAYILESIYEVDAPEIVRAAYALLKELEWIASEGAEIERSVIVSLEAGVAGGQAPPYFKLLLDLLRREYTPGRRYYQAYGNLAQVNLALADIVTQIAAFLGLPAPDFSDPAAPRDPSAPGTPIGPVADLYPALAYNYAQRIDPLLLSTKDRDVKDVTATYEERIRAFNDLYSGLGVFDPYGAPPSGTLTLKDLDIPAVVVRLFEAEKRQANTWKGVDLKMLSAIQLGDQTILNVFNVLGISPADRQAMKKEADALRARAPEDPRPDTPVLDQYQDQIASALNDAMSNPAFLAQFPDDIPLDEKSAEIIAQIKAGIAPAVDPKVAAQIVLKSVLPYETRRGAPYQVFTSRFPLRAPISITTRDGNKVVLKWIAGDGERRKARYIMSLIKTAQENGIPVAEVLPRTGADPDDLDGYFHEINGHFYIVEKDLGLGELEQTQGIREIPRVSATAENFYALGQLLGKLHNAFMTATGDPIEPFESFRPEGKKWENPVVDIIHARRKIGLRGGLEELIQDIEQRIARGQALNDRETMFWEYRDLIVQQLDRAQRNLPPDTYLDPNLYFLMSVHGDASFPNLLFTASGKEVAYIFDWERARGPMPRGEEFKNALLTGGLRYGRMYDRELLTAMLKGYESTVLYSLTDRDILATAEIIRYTFLWDVYSQFINARNQPLANPGPLRTNMENMRRFADDIPGDENSRREFLRRIRSEMRLQERGVIDSWSDHQRFLETVRRTQVNTVTLFGKPFDIAQPDAAGEMHRILIASNQTADPGYYYEWDEASGRLAVQTQAFGSAEAGLPLDLAIAELKDSIPQFKLWSMEEDVVRVVAIENENRFRPDADGRVIVDSRSQFQQLLSEAELFRAFLHQILSDVDVDAHTRAVFVLLKELEWITGAPALQREALIEYLTQSADKDKSGYYKFLLQLLRTYMPVIQDVYRRNVTALDEDYHTQLALKVSDELNRFLGTQGTLMAKPDASGKFPDPVDSDWAKIFAQYARRVDLMLLSTKNRDAQRVNFTYEERLKAFMDNYSDLGAIQNVEKLPSRFPGREPLKITTEKGIFILKWMAGRGEQEKARYMVSLVQRVEQAGIVNVGVMVRRSGMNTGTAEDYVFELNDNFFVTEEYIRALVEDPENARDIARYQQADATNFYALGQLMGELHNVLIEETDPFRAWVPEGEKFEASNVDISYSRRRIGMRPGLIDLRNELELKRQAGEALNFREQRFLEKSDFLIGQMETALRSMPRDGYMQLPLMAVHGDMSFPNLKFNSTGDLVTYLFDWERARGPQPRAEEFKNALLAGGVGVGRLYDRNLLIAMIQGYNEKAAVPLSDEEIISIIEGVRYTFLWDVYNTFNLQRYNIPADETRATAIRAEMERTITNYENFNADVSGTPESHQRFIAEARAAKSEVRASTSAYPVTVGSAFLVGMPNTTATPVWIVQPDEERLDVWTASTDEFRDAYFKIARGFGELIQKKQGMHHNIVLTQPVPPGLTAEFQRAIEAVMLEETGKIFENFSVIYIPGYVIGKESEVTVIGMPEIRTPQDKNAARAGESYKILQKIFKENIDRVELTSREAAETAQLVRPLYLAAKSAALNNLAPITENYGGRLDLAGYAAGIDERIGLSGMTPSVIWSAQSQRELEFALRHLGATADAGESLEQILASLKMPLIRQTSVYDPKFLLNAWIQDVMQSRENALKHFLTQIEATVKTVRDGGLRGARVSINGLGGPEGAQEVSPAIIRVIEWLIEQGVAEIGYWEPTPAIRGQIEQILAAEQAKPGSKFQTVSFTSSTLTDPDLYIMGGVHPQTKDFDVSLLALAETPKVLADAVGARSPENVFKTENWGKTNWTYLAPGSRPQGRAFEGLNPVPPQPERIEDPAALVTPADKPVPALFIGAGYVGLITGSAIAQFNPVTVYDVVPEKIQSLKKGRTPISEPGLDEVIQDGRKSRRLKFTEKLDAAAVRNAEVIYLAVGTPQGDQGEVNIQYILDAARSIAAELIKIPQDDRRRDPKVLVIKSTVTPDTFSRVAEVLEQAGLTLGVDVDIASNPEFLREGAAVEDVRRQEVVIGLYPLVDPKIAQASYARVKNKLKRVWGRHIQAYPRAFIVLDAISSSSAKYLRNLELAESVSFSNVTAALAKQNDAYYASVRSILRRDPRIPAKAFLAEGCGYGGSCFPKDVRALIYHLNTEFNYPATGFADHVNTLIKRRVAHEIAEVIAGSSRASGRNALRGIQIGFGGVTFKKGTDDVREASSVQLALDLVLRGADIVLYDEKFGQDNPDEIARIQRNFEEEFRKAAYRLYQNDPAVIPDAQARAIWDGKVGGTLRFAASIEDTFSGSAAFVVVNEGDEFRNLLAEDQLPRLQSLIAKMKVLPGRKQIIFDARALYPAPAAAAAARTADFFLPGIGRPEIGAPNFRRSEVRLALQNELTELQQLSSTEEAIATLQQYLQNLRLDPSTEIETESAGAIRFVAQTAGSIYSLAGVADYLPQTSEAEAAQYAISFVAEDWQEDMLQTQESAVDFTVEQQAALGDIRQRFFAAQADAGAVLAGQRILSENLTEAPALDGYMDLWLRYLALHPQLSWHVDLDNTDVATAAAWLAQLLEYAEVKGYKLRSAQIVVQGSNEAGFDRDIIRRPARAGQTVGYAAEDSGVLSGVPVRRDTQFRRITSTPLGQKTADRLILAEALLHEVSDPLQIGPARDLAQNPDDFSRIVKAIESFAQTLRLVARAA